jgi:preprotein translocase subunit SecB
MTAEAQQPQSEFAIQKIYTKDMSFETPNAPEIFQDEWKPELNLNLQTVAKLIEEDTYEVVLTVTVTVKSEGKMAFLCEVQQAGIFTLKDFPKEQMGIVQGSVCPSILFPYAREAVSDLVARGGFPQLLLAPINFDALYAQQLEQQTQGAAGATIH